jgi:uncharacterized protein
VKRFARALAALLLLAPAACTPTTSAPAETPTKGIAHKGTPDSVNIALFRESGRKQLFEWAELNPATLERAKREGKYILLDGAAEWCHWCHVMDATTYTDPEVGKLLKEKFIAIRVDIDERPDIAERYGEYGWPATILFTPAAEEIGKYRGYMPPAELLDILQKVATLAAEAEHPEPEGTAKDRPPPIEAMGWVAGRATVDMDGYYDSEEGGWGRRQKAPLGANAAFELVRASHGDKLALARAVFSLNKQRALIDPVWGGVYQYSSATHWNEPHFEKLMTFQADNLDAYARAYAATKDEAFKRDASLMASYITTFLTSADGAFLPTQDADLGGHEKGARFVDGHVYYALGDKERRALGIPRVDPHVYPLENGLAISALVTLHEAIPSPDMLAKARKAADFVLKTLVTDDGLVKRFARADAVRFLADAASFGRALVRLESATSEAKYRDAAVKIATVMLRDFEDKATGTFFDHTVDPKATGVFARRERSVTNNVFAARFLVALSASTKEPSYRDRARKLLAAISTPRALDSRGRMIGEYLLALDEAGLYPW